MKTFTENYFVSNSNPPNPHCRLDSIATLGNPQTSVTCSTHVARRLFPDANIVGAGTFEEASAHVREGRAEAFLVPGAYPDIKSFLMDEAFALAAASKHPIPALVATAREKHQRDYRKLYHHPATTPLLNKITCFGFAEAVAASSNEVAVELMLEDPNNCAAVTNELVTQHYGLPVLQVLRTERDMAWLLFVAQH